jgi:spermidine synthase
LGRSYLRLGSLALLASIMAPLVIYVGSQARSHSGGLNIGLRLAFLIALLMIVAVVLQPLLRKLAPLCDRAAARQAEFLDSIPDGYIKLAIFASAGLSLFLELAVIRWQGTIFEVFAFYKNFTLLACFAGLGLGYAMARRSLIPLFLSPLLLCWQFALLSGTRYGLAEWDRTSLQMLPFSEQLNVGLPVVGKFYQGLPVFFLLAIVFVITVLAFIPVGQLCGRLMERRDNLSAYGFNLLGSIAGVLLMFVVSAFWTPPVIWFLIAFAGLLLLHERRLFLLLFAGGASLAALVILAWPAEPAWQRIYSPYQLLEIGHENSGLMVIRAAGEYYQRVHDLRGVGGKSVNDPPSDGIRRYYGLPYRFVGRPPDEVAIVGAGSGNDVAAALLSGAKRVDAVEIDPAILMEGRNAHPNHPYSNPRVHAVLDDARSFLRNTDQRYDMIVYGLLDSHTLLTQGSSVRLDSFVYTVEALREARARLKPGGIISLSFAVMNHELGRKIYLMLQDAFGGWPPVCIMAGYDGAVVFLEANDRQLAVPAQLLQQTGFEDGTRIFADPAIQADVSTDNWPFFYMPRRVYPASYAIMGGLVLVLSTGIFWKFLNEKPQLGHAPFFLLGAGFMLIETKGITELGLVFGNTWQVMGVVIIAILAMAYLANCAVQYFDIQHWAIPYLLLFATLGLGWLVARMGGLPSNFVGRIGMAVVLTCPMFFSGIVFSTLLRSRGTVSGILAMNLLGAMCGGLLEYNSMYFGFQFLYLLAAGLYFVAFAWELARPKWQIAAVLEPK